MTQTFRLKKNAPWCWPCIATQTRKIKLSSYLLPSPSRQRCSSHKPCSDEWLELCQWIQSDCWSKTTSFSHIDLHSVQSADWFFSSGPQANEMEVQRTTANGESTTDLNVEKVPIIVFAMDYYEKLRRDFTQMGRRNSQDHMTPREEATPHSWPPSLNS